MVVQRNLTPFECKPESKVFKKYKEDPRIIYMHEILPDFQERTTKIEQHIHIISQERARPPGLNMVNAKTLLGRYFVDYASNASIHGFNHLVTTHRHPIERFLTISLILISLACLIALSLTFWNRYQMEATVTILDHNYESFQVARPSLILCPEKRIEESRFAAIFKRYGVDDTTKAREFFRFLSNVTYENMIDTPNYNGAPPNKWLQILYDLKMEVYPESSWGKDGNWFVSERGLCFSIGNIVTGYATVEYWLSNNWTLIHNRKQYYKSQYTINNLPSYTYDEDHLQGKSIQFNSSINLAIISPIDIFIFEDEMHDVKVLQLQYINLKIFQLESSYELMTLSVRQRNCKFAMDSDLTMWPLYTRRTCILECKFHIIRRHCRCLPHFARPMPANFSPKFRKALKLSNVYSFTAGVPICNSAQLRCVGELYQKGVISSSALNDCGCMRNCNMVKYIIDGKKIISLPDLYPTKVASFNIIVHFPKDKYQQVELYTFRDFLTSVGGAAGLFLGCSVLSFVEIFFYVTLRLYVYLRKNRRGGALRRHH